jgi:hypothetical protein
MRRPFFFTRRVFLTKERVNRPFESIYRVDTRGRYTIIVHKPFWSIDRRSCLECPLHSDTDFEQHGLPSTTMQITDASFLATRIQENHSRTVSVTGLMFHTEYLNFTLITIFLVLTIVILVCIVWCVEKDCEVGWMISPIFQVYFHTTTESV